ncbi:MAG: hypothetical protein OXH14_05245 [Alphaproteobacteria bacterium]|nr:hypothetical protein [Alphaproteobacteria bacterium]MCY3754551.1 hypothetical protein [Alphaproteobacteria bacterium]
MASHQIIALAVLIALGIAVDAVVKLVRAKKRPHTDTAWQRRRFALALAVFLALAAAFLAVNPNNPG